MNPYGCMDGRMDSNMIRPLVSSTSLWFQVSVASLRKDWEVCGFVADKMTRKREAQAQNNVYIPPPTATSTD